MYVGPKLPGLAKRVLTLRAGAGALTAPFAATRAAVPRVRREVLHPHIAPDLLQDVREGHTEGDRPVPPLVAEEANDGRDHVIGQRPRDGRFHIQQVFPYRLRAP